MKKIAIAVMAAFILSMPVGTRAAGASSASEQLYGKLHWRNIGPFIGGRVVAVAGVPSNQNLFYIGGVQGGVWKSTDYGQDWTNITDGKIPGIANPIGALAVAPSNANVIYAGTGEADIRGDFDTGDGVYKTTDAGKTWSYAGLRETHMTTKLVVDPRDPNVVYAASMGHVFKPNTERGIFKTSDGGKTWRKILFVDANTGGVDLVMDAHDARTLYAAMWQAQRTPWKLTNGGPGSGLYKTTDAGAHWTKLSTNRGYPSGILGKIGVAVAASNPKIVYSIVQAAGDAGGVYRSSDAGASWTHVNAEWKLRQRAFYYTAIFVDPTNPQLLYAPEVDGVYKSTNGGKTWTLLNPPHGDCHIVWINPHNPKILLEGDDGGGTVSVDGGDNWSTDHNQPTGQFYKVAIDGQFPFHVYGAQQDEGAFETQNASWTGLTFEHVHTVALGESTWVAPEPDGPYVTYGSGYYSSFVQLDRSTGQFKNVSPWPRYMAGNSASETKYRFGWTHPIFFNPANPKELLVGAQVVFSSLDHGQTWSVISPDLTRNDPSTEQPTGGPVYWDQTGAETFPDIASLAASYVDANVLWAGSADGLVHVSTDHGAHWTAVTPPQLPQWAQISTIEPSHTDKGTAFLTASRYMWDDYHPYVYETTDYGAHWTTIANGLPPDQYALAIRQDPREPRLLFAGTRSTVYVSLDGGGHWQPLTLNLPGVQVRDLAVDAREGALVAATHGRAFWVLDNLALLEQLARQTSYSTATAQLFAPETAWLTNEYGSGPFSPPNTGENPKYGATVFFSIPSGYNGKTPMTLAFVDAGGATIRSFTLHLKEKHPKKLTPEQEANLDTTQQRERDLRDLTAVEPGSNVFQWDLKNPPAFDPPTFRNVPTDDFPDTSDGPTILPGKYTVVLHYGSQTLQAPLTVLLDPRLHPATGDLEARLTLEKQILGSIDSLDRAIAAAMAAKAKLPAARRADVEREIANLVMLDVHSSEADVVKPTKIREQLAFLMNSLEGAYQKPTAAEYATYDDLKALAAAGEDRLNALTH
ncbi:MAG: glycosyl hydrolase [Candidatus Eremiobacteraeota bacterium]|nr:glycosyl hydrolase [Candidatus Eremiobacteraeota bacterium]